MKVPVDSTKAKELEGLFVEVGPRLWRVLTSYLGGRADVAEDVVLEAFARALEQASPIGNPIGWLYRTAFRLAAQENRLSSLLAQPDSGLVLADQPDDAREVLLSLNVLPSRQRAVVLLHYYLGFRLTEVARILGVTPPTVRVHLFRARNRLREIFGEEEPS